MSIWTSPLDTTTGRSRATPLNPLGVLPKSTRVSVKSTASPGMQHKQSTVQPNPLLEGVGTGPRVRNKTFVPAGRDPVVHQLVPDDRDTYRVHQHPLHSISMRTASSPPTRSIRGGRYVSGRR